MISTNSGGEGERKEEKEMEGEGNEEKLMERK